MRPSEAIRTDALQSIRLDGQEVEYRLLHSKAAKKLRIKVSPDGIDVVVPDGRDSQEAIAFLSEKHAWVIEQLERTRRIRAARRPVRRTQGEILFRGIPVHVNVVRSERWKAPNKVALEEGAITITCGPGSSTAASRSLEYWLRKQAREVVSRYVADVGKRVRRAPNRIYIMGQRTKWGNCSTLGNVSFNWRLIMAPDYVFRYIVTHEMVHLAIPDHSQRFWLTVQSICPVADRARQWLVRHGDNLRLNF